MNREDFINRFKIEEFITPVGFKEISHAVFDVKIGQGWDYTNNNLNKVKEKIKNIELPIIFTHVNRMQFLDISKDFIIVGAESDGSILKDGEVCPHINRDFYDLHLSDIPKKARIVFSRGIDVESSKLIPIPFGLEDPIWFPEQKKKDKILNYMFNPLEKKNLLYLNHSQKTNPKERKVPYDVFSNKNWCVSENTKNGDSFEFFIRKIAEHKFVVCPEGNGMGTHRMWEALYVGTFPIVRRRVCFEKMAEHLPILVVDNWSDINESVLIEQYNKFISKEWDWNFLTMSYWKNIINGSRRKLC